MIVQVFLVAHLFLCVCTLLVRLRDLGLVLSYPRSADLRTVLLSSLFYLSFTAPSEVFGATCVVRVVSFYLCRSRAFVIERRGYRDRTGVLDWKIEHLLRDSIGRSFLISPAVRLWKV